MQKERFEMVVIVVRALVKRQGGLGAEVQCIAFSFDFFLNHQ